MVEQLDRLAKAYILQSTGKLTDSPRVMFQDDGRGNITIASWNVPGVAKPTMDDLRATPKASKDRVDAMEAIGQLDLRRSLIALVLLVKPLWSEAQAVDFLRQANA